jgi:hypothetical protein
MGILLNVASNNHARRPFSLRQIILGRIHKLGKGRPGARRRRV